MPVVYPAVTRSRSGLSSELLIDHAGRVLRPDDVGRSIRAEPVEAIRRTSGERGKLKGAVSIGRAVACAKRRWYSGVDAA